jgi:hypothetical protein
LSIRAQDRAGKKSMLVATLRCGPPSFAVDGDPHDA